MSPARDPYLLLGHAFWKWAVGAVAAVGLMLLVQEARRQVDRWVAGAQALEERELQQSPLGRAVSELQDAVDELPAKIRSEVRSEIEAQLRQEMAAMITEHSKTLHPGAAGRDQVEELTGKLDETLAALRKRPPP